MPYPSAKKALLLSFLGAALISCAEGRLFIEAPFDYEEVDAAWSLDDVGPLHDADDQVPPLDPEDVDVEPEVPEEPDEPDVPEEPEEPEEPDDLGPTVEDVVFSSCSTTVVLGLSQQLIDKINCMHPGTVKSFAGAAGLNVRSGVFPYMQPPATDALTTTTAEGGTFTISADITYVEYLVRGEVVQTATRMNGPNFKAQLPFSKEATSSLTMRGYDADGRLAASATGWSIRSGSFFYPSGPGGPTSTSSASMKARTISKTSP